MATKKKAETKKPVATKAAKQAAMKKPIAPKVEESEDEPLPDDLEEACGELWEQIIGEDDMGKKSELIMRYNVCAGAFNTNVGEARMVLITKDNVPQRIVEADDEPASTPAPKSKGKQVVKEAAAKAGKSAAPLKKGDMIKFVFAGGKVDGALQDAPDGDRVWCKDGKGIVYHISLSDILINGETPSQNIARRNQSQKDIANIVSPKSTASKAAPKPKAAAPTPKKTELTTMKLTPAIEKILAQQISGADIIRQVYDLVTGWNETTKKAAHPEKWDTEDFVLMSGINRSRVKGCIDKFRS